MDYEKAYKEALAKAKKEAIDGYLDAVAVSDIFPEFAESEDEEIRNAIMEAVTTLSQSPLRDRMLAWLEKQGEQKPAWKPSDEQIMALRWVLNHIYYDSHKEEISGLLEQLKKLREE